MTNMNLKENNELKKYLESYKRLFFRKQLDSPKSKLILEKKRESLGLAKEEVDNMESLVNKGLLDSIDFISAIMDLNNSTSLSEDDLIEVDEYCKDLGLEDEDIQNCLEFAKVKYQEIEKKESTLKESESKLEVQVTKKIEQINEKKEQIKKDNTVAKNQQSKEDLADRIPSFKDRAKEILKIDNGSETNLQNSVLTLDDSDNSDLIEEVEVLTLEVINDETQNNLDENIEKQEESSLEEAEIIDIDDTERIQNEVVVETEAIENKFFDDFDENLEVEESISKENKSFLVYNADEMLSEENTLDKILDLDSRDFRLETLKTMFYNGCLICVERFKDNIFAIRGRRSFTKENIRTAFYDSYEELIDYTHAFLTKEGINDNSIDKKPLFETIFGLQCLETLSKQINKVNTMIDNSVSETQILNSIERSIGIYKANSDKTHFKTFAVRSISRDIKAIFEEAQTDYNLRDNVEQGIYKLILEAVEFINKCGLANFDIYTEDHGRTLNSLLEAKAKTKELLGKYEDGKGVSNEQYIEILKKAIIDYPFFEDTYVALSKAESSNMNKYKLLNSAIELLNKCGESANNIIEEIENVEKILYQEEIRKIDKDAVMDIKRALCEETAQIYKIRDYDTIFETEIEHFGQVISNINISSVSEETRLLAFKRDLYEIKNENYPDEIRKDKIDECKDKYSVRNWDCFKVEYDVFGKSFEGNVFAELDRQDRLTITDYCMKAIKNIVQSGKEKRELLGMLQDRNIVDKKDFRDIEKEIFGFVIPLNDEEIQEFDFMEKINKIYNESEEDIKVLDISIKNKKWEIEIPEFYRLIMTMQADYEPVIMVYTEDDKTGKKKEGFVVTDRAIYSSYAKRFLKFSEIEEIKLRNYSKVKKGERISYDGIFADIDSRDYKLCSNYMGKKEAFSKVLNKILDAYREVNGLAPIQRNTNSIEDSMIIGIDSNNILEGDKNIQEYLKVHLAENKYYELLSDLLNYANPSYHDVLIELSNLVSKDFTEKIYFNEITDGSGEKIAEACSSYVMCINEREEIYLLIDNTKKFPLQFQKLGVVISSRAIYCKNKSGEPWHINLEYVNNIKTKDDNKIQITNRIIEFPNIKNKQDLYDLRDLIEFVIVLRKILIDDMNSKKDELESMDISPAEKFTLDIVNSIESENLRSMLFMYNDGATSEKKYAAAISSYADLNDAEKPMLLLDTSTFGVKTGGLLVTDKNIYYKEGMSNSLNINLLAVSRIYIKNDKFYINGIEFKLSGLNIEEKTEFAQKLSKLTEYLKNNGFRRI